MNARPKSMAKLLSDRMAWIWSFNFWTIQDRPCQPRQRTYGWSVMDSPHMRRIKICCFCEYCNAFAVMQLRASVESKPWNLSLLVWTRLSSASDFSTSSLVFSLLLRLLRQIIQDEMSLEISSHRRPHSGFMSNSLMFEPSHLSVFLIDAALSQCLHDINHALPLLRLVKCLSHCSTIADPASEYPRSPSRCYQHLRPSQYLIWYRLAPTMPSFGLLSHSLSSPLLSDYMLGSLSYEPGALTTR